MIGQLKSRRALGILGLVICFTEVSSNQWVMGQAKTEGDSASMAKPKLDNFRTWRDKTGKFSVVAKILRLEEGNAVLLKENGKEVSVSILKLGEEDRDYLRSWLAEREKATMSAEPDPNSEPTLDTGSSPNEKIPGTSLHVFENLELHLLKRLERKEIPDGVLPNGMKMAVWQSTVDEETPETVLIASIVTDPRLKEEFKSMRQTLVNFSAGSSKSMGVKILGWGETQDSDINGISMTHSEWVGLAGTREVGGKIFGMLQDETLTSFFFISFSENPDEALAQIDQQMRTLRAR